MIYVNNLLELDINGNILTLADDIDLFFEGQNWNEVETKANIGLSIINKWYLKNSLILNNSKSVVYSNFLKYINSSEEIILNSHLNKCYPKNNIHVNCTKIKRVHSTNYLGIIFNEHLK